MVNYSGYSRELLPERQNIGTLEEIPEICINAFSNSTTAEVNWEVSRAFFITHLEEEILKDFFNSSFLKKLMNSGAGTMRVYMHQVTYNGILYWISTEPSVANWIEEIDRLKHLHLTGKICIIEKNIPFHLFFIGGHRYPDIGLTIEVTPLSAGHNPGSVMYLFEFISGPKMFFPRGTHKQIILYTGNCRVSTNDLRLSQPLYDSKGVLKKITTLYVDTMHCSWHVKELPLRSQVEDQLVVALSEEMVCTPNARFEIWMPFRLSSYNFLCTLSEVFKERIHTTTAYYQLFKHIPEIAFATTDCGHNNRFHYACAAINQNKWCSSEDSDIDYKYDVTHVTLQCDMFPSPVQPTEDEIMWTAMKKSVYFKKPDLYHGVYSANLSRYEMARIINYLGVDPHGVKPLHRPRFMKMAHVRRLLRKTCADVCTWDNNEDESEYPSRMYDFTGPNQATENYYAQARIVYLHVYSDELDPLDGAYGQGDYSAVVNVNPDSYMVPQLQKMDLTRLCRPRRMRSSSNHRTQTARERETSAERTRSPRSVSCNRPESS